MHDLTNRRSDDQTIEMDRLQIVVAQANLEKAQKELDLMLAGHDAEEVKLIDLQVIIAQGDIKKDQEGLDSAPAGL